MWKQYIDHRSLKFDPSITPLASKPKLTMSLRNDIMRFSVSGFGSDIRIELQAPVHRFDIESFSKRTYVYLL